MEVNINYLEAVMELGEKLRQARLEAGLSQRQLCGEEITRNMLSQIENGSAKPSMDTLRYLAGRLEKPVSWFLEEEGAISPNSQVMAAARTAFRQRNAEECRKHLAAYREPDTLFDPEYRLLRGLTLLALAEQAIRDGKKPYALELLEEVKEEGGQCLYHADQLERQRLLLLFRLKPEQAAELERELPSLDDELLLRSRAARETGDLSRSEALLNSMQNRDTPQWAVAMAEVLFAREEYAAAARFYAEAEDALPEQTLSRLEQCWHMLEDYKLAYYYACKQRQTGAGRGSGE